MKSKIFSYLKRKKKLKKKEKKNCNNLNLGLEERAAKDEWFL